MTKEEAIKYLQQLYPNGGHCWLDEQRIEAIGMAVKALQGEPQVKEFAEIQHVKETCKENGNSLTQVPASEVLPHIRHRDTLDEFAYQCAYDLSNDWAKETPEWKDVKTACKLGAQWQKEHLWKPADCDDLPEIDREVISLLDNGKVVFAHRPNPEGWDAKSIITEKVEHYTPETYDKGGWNIPNVKYWLDCLMPKEIEL